jgi:hypothetical protein
MDSSLEPLQSTLSAKTALRSRLGPNRLETMGRGRLRVGGQTIMRPPTKTQEEPRRDRDVRPENKENEIISPGESITKKGFLQMNARNYESKEYRYVPPAATRGFLWYLQHVPCQRA